MKIYNNVHDAYLGTLEDVLNNYEHTPSPRGQKTFEKLDYAFRIINPQVEAIKTKDEERNKVIKEYSDKEFALYESGSNNVDDYARASKFWNHLANPDGTINSAYGHLIWKKRSHGNPEFETFSFRQTQPANELAKDLYTDILMSKMRTARRTPWEWAVLSLRSDKDTRQAILRFSLPEHQWVGNKDQTCTLHGNFQIRDDKLHLSVTMRSNDLMKGLVYDLPWFVSLMYKMKEELSDCYPNLEIGSYTHIAHSMHIYEKDVQAINKMLGY